ncbi:TetR/AcrR family transcriptional regulator [Roseivirga misakiensis]|uniref:HTH tetR-type domain-containing protein n=1 Tax=Roseivirga misakiensis TaxID=1563681 RepID=A0A1E5T2Z4_9BACT|nr:TetR/AcrR family transcriptional regulator [Roseivirga misakiensis]OEK05744.1 hypothetical protein BFP71_06375 [Roseivirga misakiensis]
MARTKNFVESEALDKALDLFWQKGFHATSIQDLVNHLGINRASIYDTWGDKHGLYLETLKQYRRHSSGQFLEKLRSQKTAKEIVRDFLTDIVEDSSQDELKRGCYLSNSATELAYCDENVNHMFTDNRMKMEAVLNELIKEGQEAGEFSTKHSSESFARFIFNTAGGLRLLAKGEISKEEMADVVDVAISALN